MKPGVGIAIALSVIGLGTSFWVSHQSSKGRILNVTPQMVDQLKGVNELQMESLNNGLNSWINTHPGAGTPSAAQLTEAWGGALPKEAFSQLSATVDTYDGKRGWVYNGGSFKPNAPQSAEGLR